ncbi:MAG TPA: SurA N-terminal domain-containing protein [Candidatus Acidoferrales bacterium]|nr:SurA N-terminal domain-containing protein [Candidatus Acidoferrales bacterium]
MLSFLRRRKRSWLIVILLGVIVVSFVLYFGGSDWSQSPTDVVVEVNGEAIRQRELEVNFQRALEVYRDLFKGSLTPEMVKNLNLRESVLEDMIQRRLLLQESRRLGLEATEDELVDAITGAPVFQVNGAFSKQRYLDVLRARRMTPVQFEAEQRQEISVRKLLEMIRDSVHVSESEIRDRYRVEAEKINLLFARIGADDFAAQVKATPEEVKAFYDANQESLKEPLRVQVEYLAYPFDRFGARLEVSDKEIQGFYERERARRFTEPRAAKIRHILVREPEGADRETRARARERAERILAEATKGKDFAALARQYSEDPSSSAGGDLGWFTAGQLLPSLEKAAFALRKGEISGVVESPIGYHILKIEDTKGQTVKSLAEVKEQIAAEIRRQRGSAEAEKAAEADRERVLSGADFSQLAKERGLELTVSRLFARDEPVPGLEGVEEFYNRAFSLPLKGLSAPIRGPDAYYLLRVIQRKEPSVPPLEAVRAKIEADLKNKKAFELALQKANAALAELKKTKDFSQIAQKHGLKIEQTGWFQRNAPEVPKVGPLKELKPGGIPVSEFHPVPEMVYTQADAAYLFYFKESQPADMEAFEREKARLRAQALSQKQEAALRQFVDSLKARAKINFHAAALENI